MLISGYVSSNIMICILFFDLIHFRELRQKYYFRSFLVQIRTLKFASEIYRPLLVWQNQALLLTPFNSLAIWKLMFKHNTATRGSSRSPIKPCLTPRNFCYNSKFTSLHQYTPDQKSLAHQKSISQRFVVSFSLFRTTICHFSS